jgi:hypothetical protein
MIIFVSVLTTFDTSFVFWLSWGSREIWLELKIFKLNIYKFSLSISMKHTVDGLLLGDRGEWGGMVSILAPGHSWEEMKEVTAIALSGCEKKQNANTNRNKNNIFIEREKKSNFLLDNRKLEFYCWIVYWI